VARIFLTHPPEALANYYGDRAVAGLKALGEVRLNTAGRELTVEELIEAARGCEVIVSYRQTPGWPELFAASPDLVAFSRCAIDIRNVDVAAASAAGILVTQASAGFIASVSEWVIGAMIDLGRRITASTEAYHAGTVPAGVMGRELKGATLGILGYGQIGEYLARVAGALGMRVLVYDPYKKVGDPALTQLEMTALLSESDFVVCLVVANDSTEKLVNAAAFAAMKPGAYFINASRGNLVDDDALVAALQSGRLAGVALDVGRAPDQMPVPAIARDPKVIATPHTAGLTLPAIEHQSLETVAQVAEILQGRAPKGDRAEQPRNRGVADRREIVVEHADPGEVLGRGEAHDVVGERPHEREPARRGDRHRADHPGGATGAHRAQRRGHGHPGGEAVVDDDHGPRARVECGAVRRVGRTLRADRPRLQQGFPVEPGVVGAGRGGMRGDVHLAALVDRADRHLVGAGGAELAHEHDVQVARERVRDRAAEHHRAARDGGDERPLPAVLGERAGEPLAGFLPVAEHAPVIARAPAGSA
jgi:D-3-phosphoglycerate dehydrogenase